MIFVVAVACISKQPVKNTTVVLTSVLSPVLELLNSSSDVCDIDILVRFISAYVFSWNDFFSEIYMAKLLKFSSRKKKSSISSVYLSSSKEKSQSCKNTLK